MAFEHLPHEDRDRAVVHALAQAGDAPGALRNVQHKSRFQDAASGFAFQRAAEAAGYHFELREHSVHDSGDGQWIVEFAMLQAADLSSVQRHTKALQELSAKHGGQYLGWATQPVRLQRPPEPWGRK